MMDVSDLKSADLILRFSDPEYMDESKKIAPRRLLSGARHTEVGMGLMLNKLIAVVGGAQNCFDALPQIMHFETLDQFCEWLQVFHQEEQ